jgi:hypothetical protein
MSREPGTVVPTVISREAWEAAMAISSVVTEMLHEAGYVQRQGQSRSTESIARCIQHAINRTLDKREVRA